MKLLWELIKLAWFIILATLFSELMFGSLFPVLFVIVAGVALGVYRLATRGRRAEERQQALARQHAEYQAAYEEQIRQEFQRRLAEWTEQPQFIKRRGFPDNVVDLDH